MRARRAVACSPSGLDGGSGRSEGVWGRWWRVVIKAGRGQRLKQGMAGSFGRHGASPSARRLRRARRWGRAPQAQRDGGGGKSAGGVASARCSVGGSGAVSARACALECPACAEKAGRARERERGERKRVEREIERSTEFDSK